ncbi:hypothetical protein TTHERM_00011860 (macronuclear) [Tetrahymena thermophila SB210]|uniref:Uncharacterized protein n=1 Tax=Tetrahymena thermophila (strain SB210) TaxID=312017 RepID=Q22RV2_TETTS|nr:hypothetical protein TTHERM_00011860 [Tetrahymena thermophila SB210]EAR88020.2 hypothetical protein TTHERM_00011860 [Tetrahymena thermophila SB210]|eukprot:XP_001008265.2 hypothetical protein TTHERM_00011860 [Tetrahymena thermophila SB210]
MGCQQGKMINNGKESQNKGGFNRTNTIKNNAKNQQNVEEANQSGLFDSRNQNDEEVIGKAKGVSPSKTKDDQNDENQQNNAADNPPLKYTFTINGKSMKQIEDQKMQDEEEEDNYSDVLLSTEIREGHTPQLSEEEDYLQYERIYDKKDISLADIGDGMINDGLVDRKMTLHKAATLKKSTTLKKKLEKKAIIHALDIQPSRDYFMPDYFKQFTRKQSNKNLQQDYTKTNTLFVPQNQ